ncbi:MAG: coniferyl-aldehyde dehydrogenase [Alcanivoracaceae bacterium]|uniref:coniferyl aldehyde dehydrogenase n=1 Tax=Alcanivorax sp. MD8A TaxID=1177157 RepID=UPI000C63F616|nr:coniferyl aldehyde dehydrogenase [Alcanivorax sp. MD8A]MAX56052.1 coniferyl-aldehyde dehydrogenase [Alcanivoracaceae bacterium]MCG8438784.1 coniferyl aldehyde dehydrogenase [Pseudomonadales bacterium]MED5431963.1 coniferyl aldehyde dehydrogenase [Pseudomonadota bacterium]MEE2869130.1 coniferyl aldehyde dehydrogenase [Pseudomonadota bacterium]PNE03917.1 aldehyde dehydrogenase [Alcanivorax sp. MD8A]
MVAEVKELQQNNTEIQRMQRIFDAQKAAYRQHPYPTAEQRIDLISRIRPMLVDHQDAWANAISADFTNRAVDETKLAEIMITLEGLKYTTKRLRKWMKPSKRHVSALSWPGKTWVEYQPLGVVGIMVPWNYPIQLAVVPLITALAAGNRVMVKMSEATPRTGALLEKLIGELFPEDQVAVINGEVDVAQAFSQLPFDHLLFTGSTAVGKHVMRAAANNLTPVTLELGGKSPCIIGQDFPMKDAAERIAFGKCLNSGQTCVAPDYILCPEHRMDEFIEAWKAQVAQSYPTMVNNPDFTAIVNERQHSRLTGYIQEAREKGATVIEINPANEDFTGSQKIPHTMVLNVTDDMRIAQDEIFGPLMIVVPYKTLNEAIEYVNDRPRPLALYYFDWNQDNCDQVLKHTHSGGVCLNDTISHVGVDDIPFGGIGPSGMGAYHGPEGFQTFSKAKGIYKKGKFNATRFILPPYGRGMHKFMFKHMLK